MDPLLLLAAIASLALNGAYSLALWRTQQRLSSVEGELRGIKLALGIKTAPTPSSTPAAV